MRYVFYGRSYRHCTMNELLSIVGHFPHLDCNVLDLHMRLTFWSIGVNFLHVFLVKSPLWFQLLAMIFSQTPCRSASYFQENAYPKYGIAGLCLPLIFSGTYTPGWESLVYSNNYKKFHAFPSATRFS